MLKALLEWRIGCRVAAGFTVALIALGVVGALCLDEIDRAAQGTRGLYDHPFAVLNALNDATIQATDIRAAVRKGAAPTGPEIRGSLTALETSLALAGERYLGAKSDFDAIEECLTDLESSLTSMIDRDDAGIKIVQADALLQAILTIRESNRQDAAAFAVAAEARDRAAEHLVTAMILFAALVMLGSGWIVGRGVSLPLQRLTVTTKRLAAGELSAPIGGSGRQDEIGEISRALCVLRDVFQDRETQRWIKLHVSTIAAMLQTAEDMPAFGKILLSRLSAVVDLLYGAFYVLEAEPSQLVRAAGFAVENPDAPTVFMLGEGLVGQAAASKRRFCVTLEGNVTAKIAAGAGAIRPFDLTVLPICAGDTLLAVLEIAAASPPTARQQALIDALLPIVAVNFEILSASLATQRLLAEARVQAAEFARLFAAPGQSPSDEQLSARRLEIEAIDALFA